MHYIFRAASCLVAISLGATARGIDDGAELASAAELEVLLSGPNASDPVLPTPPLPAPGEAPGPNTGAIHLTAGVDFTSAYYSRGLRQEDRGFVMQPYASLGVDFCGGEGWNIQGYVGVWNSIHDRRTGAVTTDQTLSKWYESDAYFGLQAGVQNWTLSAQYGWFLSPSDAFTTVEELQFGAAYDDSDVLGPWALAPNAILLFETGDGTSDGQDTGVYLQLGVEPGHDLNLGDDWNVRLSLPVSVGLSVKDYYEDSAGNDELLGYVGLGAKCSCVLPISDRYGSWRAYASATLLALGDTGKELNDDEGTAWVFATGISVAY